MISAVLIGNNSVRISSAYLEFSGILLVTMQKVISVIWCILELCHWVVPECLNGEKGEDQKGKKVRKKPPKLQVWEKDSLIMKEKVSEHCDVNVPPGDWCPASLWATNTLEETWPSVSLLSMTWYGMESLWYFRSAVPAVSSPSLLCAPHWGGRGRGAVSVLLSRSRDSAVLPKQAPQGLLWRKWPLSQLNSTISTSYSMSFASCSGEISGRCF